MQKLFKVTAQALCAFSLVCLAGCGKDKAGTTSSSSSESESETKSSKTGPEKVVLDLFNAMKAGTIDADFYEARLTEKLLKGALDELDKKGPSHRKDKFKNTTFKIGKKKVDGNEAKVQLLKCKGEEVGRQNLGLVKVDGKWKISKVNVRMDDSEEEADDKVYTPSNKTVYATATNSTSKASDYKNYGVDKASYGKAKNYDARVKSYDDVKK